MEAQNSCDWLAIYQASVYQFWHERDWFAFSLDGTRENCLSMDFPDSVTLITAWNPDSEEMPLSANRQENARLLRELISHGHAWAPASGYAKPDAGEVWREEGFAVFGWSKAEACTWGKNYGQRAIVFVESGATHLLFCSPERAELCFPLSFKPA